MGSILLGIDLGTSGAKAGLYTPEGRLLAFGRSRGYTQLEPRPGWAEGDPAAWWSSVVEALGRACSEAGVAPTQIGAVGLCVFFPAVVAMDAAGKALRHAILYSDGRSLAEAAELEAVLGPGVYRRLSGNVASPGTCAATSILWLRRHEPRVWESAHVLGFANTWLTSRLTGACVTDLTHAGLSGLVDIRSPDRWDTRILSAIELDARMLPRIVPAPAVAGAVTPAAGRATGLEPGVPVVAGMGDAACGCLGAGVVEPGSVGYVAGTTDCVTVPLVSPLEDHRWLTLGYVEPGRWLGIGTMTSTGASVEWFAERFYTGTRMDRLERMVAEAQTAGASGEVLFLPYLQGERTPHWDAQARAVFSGLTLATTRAQLARAVFEGTALGLRDVVDCLPQRPSEIRACGGGMTNRLWTRLKADALGLPLTVLSEPETGSLGAAMLAAMAVGVYGGVEQAAVAARAAVPSVTVEPDPRRAGQVAERLERYRDLYVRNRGLMHELAAAGSP